MGAANTVTHSQPDIIKANVFGFDDSMDDVWLQDVTSAVQYYNLGVDGVGKNLLNLSYDDAIAAMKAYVANASGAVSVLGNGNAADYAIRSQILGTANTLTGNPSKISANNTINGYGNTGTNITHSAVVGSNNTLSNGEDNVVIGDYHNMNGGKHNVVLGSMKSKELTSQKEYKSPEWQDDKHNGVKYNVTEQVPVKEHKNDIANAVMVGYNTDATVDGGVALGSDSVASTEAGKTGYDAQGKKHANSDKDYAAWVSTDAAVSVGGADREVTYDVLDKDGKPVIDKTTGKTKQEKQIVKSTRQITNLAAGTENTDAVNVAQMKVTATAAADAVKTHFYSVNSQDTKAGNYNNDGAKGKSAINAIAAGVGASSDGDSSIAVGTNSRVASNGYSLTSIAIGKNAYVLNGTGQQEFQLSFDKGNWKYIDLGKYGQYSSGPKDISRIPGGIAIGTNSYARTGSVQIGAHTYTGKMGNMDVTDKTNSEANIVDMTTIGSNTYNRGALATMVGAYSIITGDFDGSGSNSYSTGTQNFGANVIGSLNSIRTKGYSGTSGVATSIVGIANIAENANGALIYGAGNQISNSIRPITSIDVTKGSSTVDGMVDSLRNAVQKEEGGATLAIGGGNTADWTQASQLVGVNNTLTGTETSVSKYNMINGYNNTATNVSNVKIIGSKNVIGEKANSNTLIGDNRVIADKQTNNVIIGNADETPITTEKKDTVILGHNANATVDGGVALGAGSVASREAGGEAGYDPANGDHRNDTTGTWKSTAAAVSVGDASQNITRQITNVAAGTSLTDAVNVAQLQSVASLPVHIYSGGKVSSGSYTAGSPVANPTISSLQFDFGDGLKAEEVGAEGDKRVLVSLDKNALKGDPDFKGDTGEQGPKGDKGDTGATGAQGEQGPKGDKGEKGDTGAQGEQGLKGDKGDKGDTGAPGKDGKDGGVGTVVGDDTNITVANTETDATKPANYKVSLNKAITVDKVTAGDTTISSNGVSIAGGPSMTKDGIDAAGKKITTVAAGTETTDAVNYGQLKDVESKVDSNTQNINYLNGRVGELGNRINKVGAGAAALAALHPLDFDPEDKWDFAAGVGNYRNATAAAVGLFYRPNERAMFNLGWTMGDNRNMVNGGFSLKFGKSNKYIKYSKAEMASVIDKQSREIAELKARDVQNAKDKAEMKADNAEMKAEIEALKKQVEALAAKK